MLNVLQQGRFVEISHAAFLLGWGKRAIGHILNATATLSRGITARLQETGGPDWTSCKSTRLTGYTPTCRRVWRRPRTGRNHEQNPKCSKPLYHSIPSFHRLRFGKLCSRPSRVSIRLVSEFRLDAPRVLEFPARTKNHYVDIFNIRCGGFKFEGAIGCIDLEVLVIKALDNPQAH